MICDYISRFIAMFSKVCLGWPPTVVAREFYILIDQWSLCLIFHLQYIQKWVQLVKVLWCIDTSWTKLDEINRNFLAKLMDFHIKGKRIKDVGAESTDVGGKCSTAGEGCEMWKFGESWVWHLPTAEDQSTHDSQRGVMLQILHYWQAYFVANL